MSVDKGGQGGSTGEALASRREMPRARPAHPANGDDVRTHQHGERRARAVAPKTRVAMASKAATGCFRARTSAVRPTVPRATVRQPRRFTRSRSGLGCKPRRTGSRLAPPGRSDGARARPQRRAGSRRALPQAAVRVLSSASAGRRDRTRHLPPHTHTHTLSWPAPLGAPRLRSAAGVAKRCPFTPGLKCPHQ